MDDAGPSSDAAAVSGVARQAENGVTVPQVTDMEVDGNAVPPNATNGINEEEAALYDRQLRLWGLEAQNRMRNGSVLIVNFRGIATEACKNIVLAGTGSLTILDGKDVEEEDLGAGFFLRDEDIGKKRTVCAKDRIHTLNPRVNLIAETDMSKLEDDDFLSQFTLVCITDTDCVTMERLNDRCRRLGKPFYAATGLGLHGYIFADLLHHEYLVDRESTQASGEIRKTSVKKEQDFVPLSEALKSPWKISPKRLKKVSKIMWACLALFAYQRRHGGATPEDEADATEVLQLAGPLLKNLGVDPSLLPPALVQELCRVGTAEFVPVCAVLGAILSQDILNALGGKEPPIVNFFVFEGLRSTGDIYALGVTRTGG